MKTTVSLGVGDKVMVGVIVIVGVGVRVDVFEGVEVEVEVSVKVPVTLRVEVAEAVAVAVEVPVMVRVSVGVRVGPVGPEGLLFPGQPRVGSNGREIKNAKAFRMGPLWVESGRSLGVPAHSRQALVEVARGNRETRPHEATTRPAMDGTGYPRIGKTTAIGALMNTDLSTLASPKVDEWEEAQGTLKTVLFSAPEVVPEGQDQADKEEGPVTPVGSVAHGPLWLPRAWDAWR
jgi:hypothetical protein